MTEQPPTITAIEAFGEQLDGAIARRQRRRRPRAVALTVAVTALVAAPALAATGVIDTGFDFGSDLPAPGQPGGPPLAVEHPTGPVVDVIDTLNRPGGVAKLREILEPHDLRLRVVTRPVHRKVVGTPLGVEFPNGARFDDHGNLVVNRSHGTVTVTLGRAARTGEQAGSDGLSLPDVLPQVHRAVERDDPAGTLERLRDLGFPVTVMLVVDNPDPNGGTPTGAKEVAVPPPGTVVLSILDADGSLPSPRTRALLMEVTPAGSRVSEGH